MMPSPGSLGFADADAMPSTSSSSSSCPHGPWTAVCAMWWAGFKDACSLQRAFLFCRRSRIVWIKTGQCFLLNGLIFLGSVLALQKVVVPTLNHLLNFQLQSSLESHSVMEGEPSITSKAFPHALQSVLIAICYVFWLYPLYIISFVINCIWYNEIARHAFEAIDHVPKRSYSNSQAAESGLKLGKGVDTVKTRSMKSGVFDSVVLGIGEQIYSMIMVSAFFIEVFLVSFIPYIGKFLYFLLLSWLYAYYCFDYKWNFARWSLEKRLVFFETNWAFFAGFGSPCVLATFFFSPLVSAGVMAILFPLFVLVATGSQPELVVGSSKIVMESSQLRRLPIFYLANHITLPLLSLLQQRLSFVPSDSGRKRAQ
ncbi:hypothetical protein O6H91_01G172500 [Diphasiastrum complanatum]|uniref:Uncharacterized protein n=1 Tax=Diphasiastrum complanatum TaxID=34168 RepID=A0ACC2EYX8_DIPCM|nr:hypothetical protein O6H91_01G172500 [Diphasiastrum complanatum]